MAKTSGSADAGYITLKSNITTSYVDSSTNTIMVGTSTNDYQGLELTVNYGSTQVPIQVLIQNHSLGSFTNLRLSTFKTSTQTPGGSSGAPVVRRYSNGALKRYEEMVYGIHKGIAENQVTGEMYEVYSNAAYAFNNLGLDEGIWAPY